MVCTSRAQLLIFAFHDAFAGTAYFNDPDRLRAFAKN